MTVTSGFFNAVSNDRVYDAVDLASMFDGVITEGIFPAVGTAMMVIPGTGMHIVVGKGRSWFQKTWTNNDSDLIVSLDLSEVILNRIDLAVLEMNSTSGVRANTIKIIKGVPGTVPVRPTLIFAAGVYQYSLADIYIAAGVTSITTGNITNRVGTTDCPYVSSVVSTSILDVPGTADNVLTSTGTQWVSRAPKVNVIPGAAGNILTSDGTNWISQENQALSYDAIHAELC